MEITLTNNRSPYSSAWLKLGVFSLIAAGLFSLLLVLSRIPGAQVIIPWIDFFHTALVVHVNLSVLFWFMTFTSLFWSLYAGTRFLILEKIALTSCVAGTLLLVVAPFLGAGKPLINNYIPVLQHPLFFWSLGIFTFGVLLQCIRVLLVLPSSENGVSSLAPYMAAIFSFLSLVALYVSWLNIPVDIDPTVYFEYLFWGSGHILQFSHTTLLLFSWLVLLSYIGSKVIVSQSALYWSMAILMLPLIYALYIYSVYDIFSPEHITAFTDFMKYGGLASLPLGLVVLVSFIGSNVSSSDDIKAAKAALIASFILFAAGGIIGFMIHGVNVVIPAHYHGSIVGVTLAFMGIAYYLLPLLGYRKPVWRSARLQPYVYGGGQLMHILGLAWSGGYGVKRKTAGAAQGLDSLPEVIGMGMMGLGGLISIIGGIMFLVVMLKSMWPEASKAASS